MAAYVACLAGFAASGLPATAEEAISFEKQIRPIVETYCLDCHNERRIKGDLNLERFENKDQVIDALAVWQRMAKRIEQGEMPPRDEFPLTDGDKKLVLDWIGSLKVDDADCNRIATEESVKWFPGYIMSRRLNRQEYENTLRDLLGVDVEVAELFPADGAGGEGFNNHGSALFLSAIQIEKYLEAADVAVEAALPIERPLSATIAGTAEQGDVVSARNEPAPDVSELGERIERLIPVWPGGDLGVREAAFESLAQFTEKAWRRPVEKDEVAHHLQMFDKAYNRGDGYIGGLKLAYKSVLVSPHFVFLAEPEPEQKGVYELGGFPLASRLSYFIWASMPDGELFELARAGALGDPLEIERQVRRMLADPKARALGDQFAMQWLEVSQLGETKRPDENRFPEFDAAVKQAMKDEVALYFTHIVQENRSLLDLLDSNYTIANETLASIYGLEGVSGGEMRVVEFADPNRGGVTGMAAVLTSTSHPLRTSPVLRGKWVLEQLLGDRVPPPPPNVPALPEDEGHSEEGLTLREQLEVHRKNPDCASCHARMDPIGFGMENFDPIGRWRDEQGGAPVDASGELPSGETFSGPKELKAILLQRKDAFARNLARKMLGYALGRPLHRYDECVIDDTVAALQQDDYRAVNLFMEIALSYPFRHRYSGSGE